MLLGLIIGITNYIGTTVSAYLIPKLGFQTTYNQSLCVAIVVFTFCFNNSVVCPSLFSGLSVFQYVQFY